MRRTLAAAVLALGVLTTGVAPVLAQHPGHVDEQTPPTAAGAPPAEPASDDHTHHQRPAPELPPFIPPVTEEARRAAFPEVRGHTVHDEAINYFVLLDRVEWQSTAGGTGLNVDTTGWIGRDRDRVWFRAEAGGDAGRIGEAEAHVLYGRQFSRWWDVVAGVRQDVRPGPAQTWAAVGIQGLAPYWFDVELTAYLGASGRTQLRAEVEYELLVTNRLVLQPRLEADVFGRSDPERGVGAGLSTTDAGLRLRYEIRPEIAPYIGVSWSNRWGGTADFAEGAGEETGGARFVAGMRLWF